MAANKLQFLRFGDLLSVNFPNKLMRSRSFSPDNWRNNMFYKIYSNPGEININNKKTHKSENDLSHRNLLRQITVERIHIENGNQIPDYQKKKISFGFNAFENSMEDYLFKIKTKCAILNSKLMKEENRAALAEKKLSKALKENIHNDALIDLLKNKLHHTACLLKKENELKDALVLRVEQLEREIRIMGKKIFKKPILYNKSNQISNEDYKILQDKVRQIEMNKYSEHVQNLSLTFKEINNEHYQRIQIEEQEATIAAEEANIKALIAKKNKLITSIQRGTQEKQQLEMAFSIHNESQLDHKEFNKNDKKILNSVEQGPLNFQFFNAIKNQTDYLAFLNNRKNQIEESIQSCKEKLVQYENNYNYTQQRPQKSILEKSFSMLHQELLEFKEREKDLKSLLPYLDNNLEEKHLKNDIENPMDKFFNEKHSSFDSNSNIIENDMGLFNLTSFPNEQSNNERITGKMLIDWIDENEKETDLSISSHFFLPYKNYNSLGKGDMTDDDQINSRKEFPTSDFHVTNNDSIWAN